MNLSDLEHPKLSKKEYFASLEREQLRLMKLQHGIYKQGHRVVIAVEGIDAAGKGGMIQRTTELMDPRGYHVYPIGAPTEAELAEHYLQRFWRRLPTAGQTVIFDRTWYGRVLVERVNQLIDNDTWERAYQEINEFETQLVNDGITLIKLFLSISKDEQLRRFKERIETPKKRWKITPEDILNRANWEAYQVAFQDMLSKTDAPDRPWHVIAANNKRHARIACMQCIAEHLEKIISIRDVELLDPEVKSLAEQHL